MKVKIIKSILSIYGAMVPGMKITVPVHIALSWIKNGIAECVGDAEAKAEAERKAEAVPEPGAKPKKRPKVIPVGMFWCGKCKSLHRVASKVGQRHLGYNG